MTSRVIDCLATTEALAELFSDRSVLQAMLDFETALARVEAAAGVIPEAAARAIEGAARAEAFDAAAIAAAARASATPSIPLVGDLVDRVRRVDEASARFVHWGATSQDVLDSALVLLLVRARPSLAADHARVLRALRQLSEEHASTVMLGRTLLQPATPITFGLKAAGWHAGVHRAWSELLRAYEQAASLQFGGASGTLAALGSEGPRIARALARELGLAASAPWHTERSRLAALVAAHAVYAGALAKVARDLSLLMQAEIAELAAAAGGSSTMPHKRNPAGCAVVLAAATRTPGLAASMLGAMVQEHERGVGGWQAEWPAVSETVQVTGAAIRALAETLESLQVFPERMRANLEAAGGTIYSERIVMRLRPALGRDRAEAIIRDAVEQSRAGATTFFDALVTQSDVTEVISRDELEASMRPEAYLGAANVFRQQLLEQGDR